MANETVGKEKGSGIAPFIIIGLIALATIAGIWWISQAGNEKSANTKSTTNANSAEKSQEEAANYSKAPEGASPARYKGSESATVVLEEFADFQCGACAVKHSIFNEINSEYGSKIKFVFRHFPLITQHPKAYDAAVAAEAAGLQDKFWEMQNVLFANQTKWINETTHRKTFEEYAKTIGVDMERYSNDALGLPAKNRVDADMRRGNALGVRSTPTLFVNGRSIPYEQMTLDSLKAVIDAELEKFSPKKEEEKSEDESKKDGEKDEDKKDAAKKEDSPSEEKADESKEKK